MENIQAVTCQIRYTLDLDKLTAFERYARTWVRLIERYGGIHHGYFKPRASPDRVGASFPDLVMMARLMSPSLCSQFQTKKATDGIVKWLPPIPSANRLRLSFERVAALLAMRARPPGATECITRSNANCTVTFRRRSADDPERTPRKATSARWASIRHGLCSRHTEIRLLQGHFRPQCFNPKRLAFRSNQS